MGQTCTRDVKYASILYTMPLSTLKDQLLRIMETATFDQYAIDRINSIITYICDRHELDHAIDHLSGLLENADSQSIDVVNRCIREKLILRAIHTNLFASKRPFHLLRKRVSQLSFLLSLKQDNVMKGKDAMHVLPTSYTMLSYSLMLERSVLTERDRFVSFPDLDELVLPCEFRDFLIELSELFHSNYSSFKQDNLLKDDSFIVFCLCLHTAFESQAGRNLCHLIDSIEIFDRPSKKQTNQTLFFRDLCILRAATQFINDLCRYKLWHRSLDNPFLSFIIDDIYEGVRKTLKKSIFDANRYGQAFTFFPSFFQLVLERNEEGFPIDQAYWTRLLSSASPTMYRIKPFYQSLIFVAGTLEDEPMTNEMMNDFQDEFNFVCRKGVHHF